MVLFIGIKEIDLIILSYIDDDYFLYKLCRLNSYLETLYESNDLWILKINHLFTNLVITQSEVKKLYFDINKLHFDGHDKLCEYAIKNRYNNILDWIFKYHKDEFKNEDIIIHDIICAACKSGNLDIIKYFIETFGVSEQEIVLECPYDRVFYFTSKNGKCAGVYYDPFIHSGFWSATVNGHTKILDYFEKYGITYNTETHTKQKIYPLPDNNMIDEAYKNGHYNVVNWYEQRGLYTK